MDHTIQVILISVVAVSAAIIVIGFLYLNYFMVWYQRKTSSLEFRDLIEILTATIKTELDLYEKDIFNSKNAITNSNFDNYYNDLCTRIANSLSKPFIDQLTVYITYETIISYIARSVKEYLTTKINGTF